MKEKILMEEIETLFAELERFKKSKELFLEEFKHEYYWQMSNARGGDQWHKGALKGFEHSKRIFDKYFQN